MSRPRKQRATRLSRQIAVRLTEAEHAELMDMAHRAGVRPAELARLLIRRRRGNIAFEVSRIPDPAILKRMDRIGWNLNQLVKNAHIFKHVSPNVERLCNEIRALIDGAVTERIGE